MRIIDRYLFRQLLGPTAVATCALSAVALLSQSLGALDVIVDQRQSAWVFAKIILLATPQLINMVLPIALFVAMLVALNRLHTEQEIVVCFASGMSRLRVISPAMRLAAAVALIALTVNLWIQPACQRATREIFFQIRADLASTLLREGEFTEPAPGVTVYAQSIEGDGTINNLFIHRAQGGGRATTYTAAEGRLAEKNGRPVLIMKKGSIQQFSRDGVLNFLAFDENVFELQPLIGSSELVFFKASDRYLHELFFPDLTQAWERANRLKLLAEGHARLSRPLYNLTFAALAVAAIVGGSFSRLGYGRRIAVASSLAIAARVVGFGVEAGSQTNDWLNILQYAIPIGVGWGALAYVFRARINRHIPIERDGAPRAAPA